MDHLHAVILAGGSGTRLWPLSTPLFPKQFLPLPGGKSMIQETLARVEPLITPNRSWVVTGRSMTSLVHEHLPTVPLSHILGEPMGRNTAPALCWVSAMIAQHDPEAIMASLHADAAITKADALRQSLHLAYQLANQGYLVTLGIKPTSPETGYGYIRFSHKVDTGFGLDAFNAERFVEKPTLATAQQYLADGHYVWNSGMFIWKVETILAEFREHLPELATKIERIVEASGTSHESSLLDELWPMLPTISIDTGIMEKTRKLVVVPVDLGWNDVGNWEQYGTLFPANEQGVRAVGEHVALESQNIFVYNNSKHPVYTIGLEDVIVVEMDDKTVICHKDHVQRVKELAERELRKPL